MCACIYTYGVAHEEMWLEEFNDFGNHIYPITHCGLSAVVQRVSEEDFSEETFAKNVQEVIWLESKIRQHNKVLSVLAERITILPFKFATVFFSEENVRGMLTRYELPMKARLHQLTGKIELGLRIWGNYSKLSDYVEASNNEIKNIKKEIVESSPGKAFLLNKKIEGVLESSVHSFFDEQAKSCFHDLVPFSYKNMLLSGLATKGNEIVLKAAFLVDRDETESFLHEIEKKRKALGAAMINLECTGPWPPYNFADLVKN